MEICSWYVRVSTRLTALATCEAQGERYAVPIPIPLDATCYHPDETLAAWLGPEERSLLVQERQASRHR